MRYDVNSRTFVGEISNLPEDKANRLAVVQVDCGIHGVAVFKLAIKKSPKGNPVVTIRTLKPKTGEFKRKELMAVPVVRKANNDDEVTVPPKTKTKAKKKPNRN